MGPICGLHSFQNLRSCWENTSKTVSPLDRPSCEVSPMCFHASRRAASTLPHMLPSTDDIGSPYDDLNTDDLCCSFPAKLWSSCPCKQHGGYLPNCGIKAACCNILFGDYSLKWQRPLLLTCRHLTRPRAARGLLWEAKQWSHKFWHLLLGSQGAALPTALTGRFSPAWAGCPCCKGTPSYLIVLSAEDCLLFMCLLDISGNVSFLKTPRVCKLEQFSKQFLCVVHQWMLWHVSSLCRHWSSRCLRKCLPRTTFKQ